MRRIRIVLRGLFLFFLVWFGFGANRGLEQCPCQYVESHFLPCVQESALGYEWGAEEWREEQAVCSLVRLGSGSGMSTNILLDRHSD